ncbi:hypothetical protein P170DRAFT_429574 [Aspergillus steynii IBT 23096]|uniref:Opine dehydrogenase domain-containing protein n=1 Tax=Aspergillus steynii IBT 23096 TaxID=1392250 RepID=A0A2I2FW52_9EURO|nr:uncharacterized protein P170DRAFT_429574 [Aspergillus steynii IBT 23096]PLB44837.1 hypothetical protein P170DRAFT_429574 [Aspergillus steynii IBT 23096]
MSTGSPNPQSVTIIGAGNSGCAFVADLASRGFSDNGCRLNARGYFISGKFEIKTTCDASLAIKHSPFLIFSQFDLSKHTLIVNSGNFFYLAARLKIRCHTILEANTSAYAGIKKSLIIWAGAPTMQSERQSPQAELAFHQQVQSIFSPNLVWCKNLLEVGLNNVNPVVHSPTILMNAGCIESTVGDFYFYGQGMSPAVSKVIEKADQERLTISRAYGFEIVDATTQPSQNYQYDREFRNFHEFE